MAGGWRIPFGRVRRDASSSVKTTRMPKNLRVCSAVELFYQLSDSPGQANPFSFFPLRGPHFSAYER